jgi:hypothetical protein
MTNPAIVRNRLKIESAITNAKAFLEVQREFGTFDRYVWSFVRGKPHSQSAPDDEDGPRANAGIGCAFEGLAEARISIRRHDDHLRVHAGDRSRQRPSRRVSSLDRRSRHESGALDRRTSKSALTIRVKCPRAPR